MSEARVRMAGSPPPDPVIAEPPVRLSVRGLQSRLAGPFDLDVRAGECLAITGPSGAGKSLLLRMLADLDPSAGHVYLDGQPRERWSGPQWRRRVVYSAAETSWWAPQVIDHFAPEVETAAHKLLPQIGLALETLLAPVMQLSTGERQRLALVRALALESPVLLLDEPTGAVDEGATGQIEAVLRERLSGGLALLLVTHDLRLATRLATRRSVLVDGRLEQT